MRRLLSSRRRRRKLGWITGLLALAGALTFVGLHWSNTGHDYNAPFTTEPVQTVAAPPKAVPFTGKERDEVRQIAAHFVATAVIRRHLEESWELVTPSLKEGMTRAEWLRGEIPVVPYPADAVGLVKSKLDFSYPTRVGLRVGIFPKAGSKVRAQTFEIELVNVSGPDHPHWLVSYWAPVGGQGVPAAPSDGTDVAYSAPKGIGAVWLLVPVGMVLGSLLVLIATLAVRGHMRRVRAERRYNSSSSPS